LSSAGEKGRVTTGRRTRLASYWRRSWMNAVSCSMRGSWSIQVSWTDDKQTQVSSILWLNFLTCISRTKFLNVECLWWTSFLNFRSSLESSLRQTNIKGELQLNIVVTTESVMDTLIRSSTGARRGAARGLMSVGGNGVQIIQLRLC
jgi:hypothetical protein